MGTFRWRRRPLLQQTLKAGYPSHQEGFRKTVLARREESWPWGSPFLIQASHI